MINKRGQELSIGTLVLIVLGIIVLVLLVLGFSMGWENLFSKIGIFQGSDLSSMVAACKVAVSSQSQASFCEFKKVKIEGNTENINCADSRVTPSLGGDTLTCNSPEKNTCMGIIKTKEDIAVGIDKTIDKAKYNGKTCRQILKGASCTDIVINGITAQAKATCTGSIGNVDGETDITHLVTINTGLCCIKFS